MPVYGYGSQAAGGCLYVCAILSRGCPVRFNTTSATVATQINEIRIRQRRKTWRSKPGSHKSYASLAAKNARPCQGQGDPDLISHLKARSIWFGEFCWEGQRRIRSTSNTEGRNKISSANAGRLVGNPRRRDGRTWVGTRCLTGKGQSRGRAPRNRLESGEKDYKSSGNNISTPVFNESRMPPSNKGPFGNTYLDGPCILHEKERTEHLVAEMTRSQTCRLQLQYVTFSRPNDPIN